MIEGEHVLPLAPFRSYLKQTETADVSRTQPQTPTDQVVLPSSDMLSNAGPSTDTVGIE
jgi:hypothetical protein